MSGFIDLKLVHQSCLQSKDGKHTYIMELNIIISMGKKAYNETVQVTGPLLVGTAP